MCAIISTVIFLSKKNDNIIGYWVIKNSHFDNAIKKSDIVWLMILLFFCKKAPPGLGKLMLKN